jgi:hypothetical protein
VGIRGSTEGYRNRGLEGEHSSAINAEEWVDPYLYSRPRSHGAQTQLQLYLVIHSYLLLVKNRNIKIYRPSCACTAHTVCPAWSLTLQKEHRLSRFHNRVLSKISWPKRREGTGNWRKVPNERLQDLYCSPNITQVIKSRRITWGDHVAWGRKERLCWP